VRGADVLVWGATHLTFPSLRDGPLPLPPKGGEGLLPQVAAADRNMTVERHGNLAARLASRTALPLAERGQGGGGLSGVYAMPAW
jgi:hypothetical protein